MRNVLIMGTGRSGTSLLAGSLSKSGYFMGENLYGGRVGNPHGLFESWEINSINEDIIAPVSKKRPPIISRWFFKDRPTAKQLWLARIQPGTPIPTPADVPGRITSLTQRTPYCFKDSRFSYTLNVWRPYLNDCRFICVFREPGKTASSILREIAVNETLDGFKISFDQALQVWECMYGHILEEHRFEGEWSFVHYDQLMEKEGLLRVGQFLDAPIDFSFPDAALKRSKDLGDISPVTKKTYETLCELASYHRNTRE